MKNVIIAVDFDGTIADHRYPDIGPEIPGAFKYLKCFQDAGAKLILYTMRSDVYLDQAVEFCKIRGITFWGINENPEQKEWTSSPKVYAHRYIDDAAAGISLRQQAWAQRPYVDWFLIGPEILTFISRQIDVRVAVE